MVSRGVKSFLGAPSKLMNWVGLRKRFGNADRKWMQKSTAPYINPFSRNNNSQLGTEILGAFFVLELGPV